jgi:hypothetical protein
MSGDELKALAAGLPLQQGSFHDTLRRLLLHGLFDAPVLSAAVALRVVETSGQRIATGHVQTYMRKFMEAGIIRAVKPNGSNKNYYALASLSHEEALRKINKDRRMLEVEEQLFSEALTKRLSRDFSSELKELQDNFGKHGNATAFLLRKILEKLLIIVFGKLGKSTVIEDKGRPGGWRGLQEMVDIAAREKVGGLPILTGKTASEIRGVKFLGDTAAHNPLVDVDMKTIIPQMPFLITAFGELARHL